MSLLEAALTVSHLLCSAEAPESVLGEVAELLGRAVQASDVVVGLFGDDGRMLRVVGAFGQTCRPAGQPDATIPATWLAADAVPISSRAPVFLHTSVDDLFSPTPADAARAESGMVGLFPIVARGAAQGILFVSFCCRDGQMDAASTRLCQSVAEQIAAAIDAFVSRARYEQRLAQSAAQASLVRMVLEGRGLAALTAALADLLGNPVTVADGVFHLLAYSPNQERTDRHRQEALVNGGTPRRVLDDPAVRRHYQQIARLQTPFLLASFPQHGWVQRRMQAPILMGHELLGRVTVAEADRPFAEADYAILREATVALALELMKQRAALETEHRLRADFLRDLLAGPTADRSAIIARAGFLGIDLLRPWDLLVLEVDGARNLQLDYEDAGQLVARRRVFETVSYAARRECAQSVPVVHGESILVLVPSNKPAGTAARALADTIRQEITRISLQATVSVGLGATCKRIEDFAHSYAQARRALDILRSLGRSNATASLDDLGVYGMLFRTEDEEELARFADRMLGPLLEYDHRHGGALVETLHAYLEENGNHRRTAARLYVHVNTLSGRLERIATVGKLDIEDATTRLNLGLALRILQLTGTGHHRS
ncbi:MAG: helix-turn-helix domain-containing protein [Chloroflexi bacterium]|nr:helix-turn-helix domain-containing protein [Chloroflexota bacterium]